MRIRTIVPVAIPHKTTCDTTVGKERLTQMKLKCKLPLVVHGCHEQQVFLHVTSILHSNFLARGENSLLTMP